MQHALIVAHGQPSDPEPAEASLAEFAEQVNALTDGVSVQSATLAAPGRLEAAMDALPASSVIYPLFMAKGWFVTSALPKRVGDRNLRILDPLGTDPELPDLIGDALNLALSKQNWDASETDLIIAAHGSGRSRNPSAVAAAFAEQLGQKIAFHSIRLGFVEESPSIFDAANGAADQAFCLPFFACRGGHVLDDVPEALEQAEFNGAVLPVVGELPPIQRQIAAKLQSALATV